MSRKSLKSSPFLITALDPYHDASYRLEGMPDESVNPSFVRQFRDRKTVTKPVAVGAGSWDVWVISTPFLSHDTAALGTLQRTSFTTSATISSGTVCGPYLICPVPAGQSWSWAIDNGTAQSLGAFAESYEVMRQIGAAFEVTNTTAELYKQGECIVYRAPECEQVSFRPLAAAYTNVPTLSGIHLHPATVAGVQTLLGTINYPAERGALVVATQNVPCPYNRYTSNYVPCLSGGFTTSGYFPVAPITFAAIDVAASNTRPHGAVFTGLSDQSTFTVTCRINAEVSPNPLSVDAYLASKPPSLNPRLLQIYQNVAMAMPTGVPVSDNASGDWFRMVEKLAHAAYPQYSPLISIGASLARRYMNPRKTQDEKKNNQALRQALAVTSKLVNNPTIRVMPKRGNLRPKVLYSAPTRRNINKRDEL